MKIFGAFLLSFTLLVSLSYAQNRILQPYLEDYDNYNDYIRALTQWQITQQQLHAHKGIHQYRMSDPGEFRPPRIKTPTEARKEVLELRLLELQRKIQEEQLKALQQGRIQEEKQLKARRQSNQLYTQNRIAQEKREEIQQLLPYVRRNHVMVENCKEVFSETGWWDAGLCVGYIGAVLDTVHSFDLDLYCVPGEFTTNDAIRKFVEFMDKPFAKAMFSNASSALIASLHSEFPCESDEEEAPKTLPADFFDKKDRATKDPQTSP